LECPVWSGIGEELKANQLNVPLYNGNGIRPQISAIGAPNAETRTHTHTTYESLLAAAIMSSSNLITKRNELNVKDQARVGRDLPEVLVAIPELWWYLDDDLLAELHASHYSFPACNNSLLA
jgi:hypothetical protein